MIPLRASLRKGISRVPVICTGITLLATASSVRFQSTATNAQAAPGTQPTTTQKAKGLAKEQGLKTFNKTGPRRHRKVRDISNQIRQSVSESTTDLTESIEMLDEGLSYLREIQLSENIPEDDIYFGFQPIINDLLTKITKEDVSTGDKSLEDVLNLLIQHKVVHRCHFSKIIIKTLNDAPNDDMLNVYKQVLNYWVQYLQMTKEIGERTIDCRGMWNDLSRIHLINLVYFSIVQSCILQDTKIDMEIVYKVLGNKSEIENYHVVNSLKKTGLFEKYDKDMHKMTLMADKLYMNNLDPNLKAVSKRISQCVREKNPRKLNDLTKDLFEVSKSKNTPISESTLQALMGAYYDMEAYENVISLFQDLVYNGLKSPKLSTWNYILRTLGNPKYLAKVSSAQATSLFETFESTIKTMKAHGLAFSPATKSAIISSLASFGKFDKLEEALEEYKDIPTTNDAKNGILRGYIASGRVVEAEDKLKEFLEEDEMFVPSTYLMNSFLNHYANSEDYKAVEGIASFMAANKVPDDVATISILVEIFFKAHKERGLIPDMEELFTSLDKFQTKFNDYVYTQLIDGLVNMGDIEGASRVYRHGLRKLQMRSIPRALGILMRGEISNGNIRKGEDYFEEILKTGYGSSKTWNTLIRELLRKNEDDLALVYFNNMKEAGKLNKDHMPNIYTYYFLLDYYVKRNSTVKIQRMINEMSNLKVLGNELPRLLNKLATEGYTLSPELKVLVAQITST